MKISLKNYFLYFFLLVFVFSSFFILFQLFNKYYVGLIAGRLTLPQILFLLLSLSLFIFSIVTLFLNNEKKINILLLLISVAIALIIIELGLVFIENQKIKSFFPNYTSNSKYEEFIMRKKLSQKPVFAIPPSNFVKQNNYFKDHFPLSGISNANTIYCNENGYWSFYKSDRYGFNNNDKVWDRKNIDYLLLGDSTMHGACVNNENSIKGNLQKLDKKANIINLGYAGSGTLIEYSTLREYFVPGTKRIIFLYSEENDLKNLRREIKSPILSKYLKKNYTQNLKTKQKYLNENLLLFQNDQIKEFKKNKKNKVVKVIYLQKLRKILFSKTTTIRKIYPEDINNFKNLMILLKDFAKINNSDLYFIYSPDFNRYSEKYQNKKNLYDYDTIIKIIKDLNINIIDLHTQLFLKHKDPMSLFPMRSFGHYNEKGYEKTAETIYEIIKSIEN